MALYNISAYSQYTEVLIGFMLCHTTSIFRQIAQIEHFSYAYFRVLFLACDGRRRGDPNDSLHWGQAPVDWRLTLRNIKMADKVSNQIQQSDPIFPSLNLVNLFPHFYQ